MSERFKRIESIAKQFDSEPLSLDSTDVFDNMKQFQKHIQQEYVEDQIEFPNQDREDFIKDICITLLENKGNVINKLLMNQKFTPESLANAVAETALRLADNLDL